MLREFRLSRPITGRWPFLDYPPSLELRGRRFVRARWSIAYPGVVAQYREDRSRRSAHLKVLENGTWVIDHRDEYNPDRGAVLAHAGADTSAGKALRGAGRAAAMLCLGRIGAGVSSLTVGSQRV